MARNALFIMCDQLRWDYLGCTGHPTIRTPHIDALAARGVVFSRTYAQSTICGPSRMSAYTGRYMRSHGSTQNGVPLRVGEPTLGDHLRSAGVRCVLAGKTHMTADREGMARLGIDPSTPIGVQVAQCGFEPWERDDGLHPDGPYDPDPAYDSYLRARGYEADNPWEHWANSAEDPEGNRLSGWLLAHADKPARIPAEHSETPYMTRRAMDFIARAGDTPWCLHLSYIKPHWPYIVPAPYHAMYGAADILPPQRSADERVAPHPLYAAYMDERISRNLSRDDVRDRLIPCYMGLISQIDDAIGDLMAFLSAQGLDRDTLVVFTSDHGDYLGDHWLGEKYLFHDASVRVPLIVADPSPEADRTRGTRSDALVELIDIAPTLLDWFGAPARPHILEGRSLRPLLTGQPVDWRTSVISEYDFAFDASRLRLGHDPRTARATMVADARWKYIHVPGMEPMLYDRNHDPFEFQDLGRDVAMAGVLAEMESRRVRWLDGLRHRVTVPDDAVTAFDDAMRHYDPAIDVGILIGYVDEAEVRDEERKRDAYRT